jgi:hypothetical protein
MAKVNTGQRATNQLNPYAKLTTLTAISSSSAKADPVHIVAEIPPTKIKKKIIKEDCGSLERERKSSPEAVVELALQK